MTISETSTSAEANLSHINNIARAIYSMPPAHGGSIVKDILLNLELRDSWESELDAMKSRINGLRAQLSDSLNTKTNSQDFSFIKDQRGMFTLLGISKEQVEQLKSEYGIYMVGSSRINIAGISNSNLDYLTDSIVKVI